MVLSNEKILENKKEIIGLLESTKRKGIENLIKWYSSSDFFTAPASTMYHGNFMGGLAAHSLAVYKAFDSKLEEYRFNVPKDERIISGIGHDACKINIYVPNILDSGARSKTKPFKVQDNFPIGHGEKSVILIQELIPLTQREKILIRWHMGNFDRSWDQYAKNVLTKYPEVLLLYHADNEVSTLNHT